jgi:uncharacterized protein (DUF302 family)
MSDDDAEYVSWHQREIGRREVAVSFALPTLVNADEATAIFEDGVSRLTLQKLAGMRVRRIAITASESPQTLLVNLPHQSERFSMAIHSSSYGFGTEVSWSQHEAIDRVTVALREESFGVLTTIDVQETLKEKLGMDSGPYVMLAACNPCLAHQALISESEIGLLLPCNALVYQANGVTTVAVMDPQAAFALTGNADIEPIALEVKARLERVLNLLAESAA